MRYWRVTSEQRIMAETQVGPSAPGLHAVERATKSLTPKRAHGLAKRVQTSKHPFFKPELTHEAAALPAKEPRRMRLVHNDVSVPPGQQPLDAGNDIFQGCDVAVHAVHALDGHEHRPLPVANVLAVLAAQKFREYPGQVFGPVEFPSLPVPSGELCLNASRRPARLGLIPSWTLAWISSSYTITSPGCGTQLKKPTLASNPELKSRPAGALWNAAKSRSSDSAGDELPSSNLEPPEPKSGRGGVADAYASMDERYAWRTSGMRGRERYELEEKSTLEPGAVVSRRNSERDCRLESRAASLSSRL